MPLQSARSLQRRPNYYQGTPCVFPAPKHLQSPANSEICTCWNGQSLCEDAQNRQNTAPIWNSQSSIHFFNCKHLELHLECCLGLLALHWFNKRDVAMLARPTGIKFFRNRFKDHLLASGMTSLRNESYQREALTENGGRLQRTDSMPK